MSSKNVEGIERELRKVLARGSLWEDWYEATVTDLSTKAHATMMRGARQVYVFGNRQDVRVVTEDDTFNTVPAGLERLAGPLPTDKTRDQLRALLHRQLRSAPILPDDAALIEWAVGQS